jgi:hypothetical protein
MTCFTAFQLKANSNGQLESAVLAHVYIQLTSIVRKIYRGYFITTKHGRDCGKIQGHMAII